MSSPNSQDIISENTDNIRARKLRARRAAVRRAKAKARQRASQRSRAFSLAPDQPRFQIMKWSAVAIWTFQDGATHCGICRNTLMDLCIDCEANVLGQCTEECGVAWGMCNHSFHMHCISRWLKRRNCCPLCMVEWDLQKYDSCHSHHSSSE